MVVWHVSLREGWGCVEKDKKSSKLHKVQAREEEMSWDGTGSE